MVGITIGGRIYLHSSALQLPAVRLLTILHHEGIHVLQQRKNPLSFYTRYVASWIGHLFLQSIRPATGNAVSVAERFNRAYLAIGAEREAYGSEQRFERVVAALRTTN
jgi:hypothetical protein